MNKNILRFGLTFFTSAAIAAGCAKNPEGQTRIAREDFQGTNFNAPSVLKPDCTIHRNDKVIIGGQEYIPTGSGTGFEVTEIKEVDPEGCHNVAVRTDKLDDVLGDH